MAAKRTGRWTPEEDEILKKKYSKIPTHELAEELGRTYKSVWSRARKFGMTGKRYRTYRETPKNMTGSLKDDQKIKDRPKKKGVLFPQVGQRYDVLFIEYDRSLQEPRKVFNVKVESITENLVVVDCGAYKESFRKFDIGYHVVLTEA